MEQCIAKVVQYTGWDIQVPLSNSQSGTPGCDREKWYAVKEDKHIPWGVGLLLGPGGAQGMHSGTVLLPLQSQTQQRQQ